MTQNAMEFEVVPNVQRSHPASEGRSAEPGAGAAPPSTSLQVRNPMDLMAIALNNEAGIDVIERIAALMEKERSKQAEVDFNEAMNRVQKKLTRIAPDLSNPQTKSKYASYAALDKVVRPIYSEEGFSLSFGTEECPHAETVRIVCHVALGGHTRKYQIDMPADGKGAKGGDVMTRTHATGAAISYGSRYLLKSIFNIAVGEEDTDGNLTMGWLDEQLDWIASCKDLPELQKIFGVAWQEAKANKAEKAMLALIAAKDKRKAELA
jgi:hypothetical protein